MRPQINFPITCAQNTSVGSTDLARIMDNPSSCHPEPLGCHPEPLGCHPERSEGSAPRGKLREGSAPRGELREGYALSTCRSLATLGMTSLLLAGFLTPAARGQTTAPPGKAYLFSYFTRNG